MDIILASASPRRQALLEMLGVNFRVIPSESEEVLTPGLTPEQTVCKVAFGKVSQLRTEHDILEDALIIAADTLVYLDGRPLGKPDSPEDAVDMLCALSGRRHTVYTGVAIARGDTHVTGAEATDVYFRELSEGEITRYVETGEPLDKAGSYGAQGRGSVFIERIEGDFFNVMGLPLCRLSVMLRNFGIML